MNLTKLKLRHFRNYEDASFSFQKDTIHVLFGSNAQGKTNLIEAIYFLSHLRSFRVSNPEFLKQHGSDSFLIDAALESGDDQELLKVSMVGTRKNLFRFDKPVRTFSSFVGLCNALLFCPDDMMLFSAPPKERRRFIDVELIKLDPLYTSELSEYQKLLKLRNTALKQDPVNENLIAAYTEQMIKLQEDIILKRKDFICELSDEVQKVYPFFTDTQEKLTIQYSTFVHINDQLKENLQNAYGKAAAREQFSRTTAVGIHKDDVLFFMNGLPVINNASQGQKRSFLLALKLGLASLIRKKQGEYPILLLDDVFSELDQKRREQLIRHLPEKMQIFITTAEPIDLSNAGRPVEFYTVQQGLLERKEAINE